MKGPEETLLRMKEKGVKARRAAFYIKQDGYWKQLADADTAQYVRSLYTPKERNALKSQDVKEAMERLRQDPDYQLKLTEEEKSEYVNLANGVYDVKNGTLLTDGIDQFTFGYVHNFSYIGKEKRNSENFDQYCKSSFPLETEVKRKFLMQIMGYVLSDFLTAKSGFFFIGESNSGKSVLLDMLEKVVPQEAHCSIPLYRLDNRFNLARLDGKKMNISHEVSEKSFKALDIYKMLTANEVVTAEHKGKTPFEFRIRCKTINAGNVLPHIGSQSGMAAIINRMQILLFPVSIPREQQDKHLPEKLWEERDSILSEAMDELTALYKDNFKFAEPTDTAKLIDQMKSVSEAFEDFINECCVKEKDARTHISVLYKGFQEYSEANLFEEKLTRTQFTQKLCRINGVDRKKIRIGVKSAWGVEGLKMKEDLYDFGQDSAQSDENTSDGLKK